MNNNEQNKIIIKNFTFKLILLYAFFIFFQQVFVINIGGSFKIPDLICLLIFLNTVYKFDFKIYTYPSIVLFFFFVVSSAIGFSYFLLTDGPSLYYSKFPIALTELRFNVYLAPIIVYLYCLITWNLVNQIAGFKGSKNKIILIYKWYLLSAVLSCLYALYAMIFVGNLGFPDLIPSIFDFRNSRPVDYPLRTIGFCSEPGQLAVMLFWPLLYSVYIPNIFNSKIQIFFSVIILLTLLLTFSTFLLVFFGAWLGYEILQSKSKRILKILFILILVVTLLYFLLDYYNLLDLIEYYYVGKLKEFIDPANSTGDGSGNQRAYSSALGFLVFLDFPLFGVGAGNSYYFLHLHQFDLPFYSSMLTHTTAPQSSHSMVLAEQGFIGYSLLILFFTLLLISSYKKREVLNPTYIKCNIIGIATLFGALFAIYPIYSNYLWFNVALLMCNLRKNTQLID